MRNNPPAGSSQILRFPNRISRADKIQLVPRQRKQKTHKIQPVSKPTVFSYTCQTLGQPGEFQNLYKHLRRSHGVGIEKVCFLFIKLACPIITLGLSNFAHTTMPKCLNFLAPRLSISTHPGISPLLCNLWDVARARIPYSRFFSLFSCFPVLQYVLGYGRQHVILPS